MVDTTDNEVTPTRMKQAAYARHRNCSRQHISRLVLDDKIPTDSAGLILVEAADAILGPTPLKSWRYVIEGQELLITPGLERSGDVAYLSDVEASVRHRNALWAYELKRLPRYAPHLTRAALEGGEALVVSLLEQMVCRLTDGLNFQLEKMSDEFSTDGLIVKQDE